MNYHGIRMNKQTQTKILTALSVALTGCNQRTFNSSEQQTSEKMTGVSSIDPNDAELQGAKPQTDSSLLGLGFTTSLFAEGSSSNVSLDEAFKSKTISKINYTSGTPVDYGVQVSFNGLSGSFKFSSDAGQVNTAKGRTELSELMNSSGSYLSLGYSFGNYLLFGMYGKQKGFYVDRINDEETIALPASERFHESLSLKQMAGSVYYFFNDQFDVGSIAKIGVLQISSSGSPFVSATYDDIDFSAEKEFLPKEFSEKWQSISNLRGLTVQSLSANGGYIYNYINGPVSLTGALGVGFGAGKVSIQTTSGQFSRGQATQQPISRASALFGSEYNFGHSFVGMRGIVDGPSVQLDEELSVGFPLMSIKFAYGTRF